jgi:hypothetical protein
MTDEVWQGKLAATEKGNIEVTCPKDKVEYVLLRGPERIAVMASQWDEAHSMF